MATLNERLAKNKAQFEQLTNQKKEQDRKERSKRQKVDSHRNFLIGEMFCRHFPEAMEYLPKRTKAENAKIFAPLEDLIREFAKKNTKLQPQEDEDDLNFKVPKSISGRR